MTINNLIIRAKQKSPLGIYHISFLSSFSNPGVSALQDNVIIAYIRNRKSINITTSTSVLVVPIFNDLLLRKSQTACIDDFICRRNITKEPISKDRCIADGIMNPLPNEPRIKRVYGITLGEDGEASNLFGNSTPTKRSLYQVSSISMGRIISIIK